ncbi:MAG: prepilin peptidase [Pseudomonadota bacterium]|nr:prepilin peptidase [Pseudomonadota bacterium]
MLAAVAGIPFGYVLCGVIWALALGFAVGNYACSLVHRLPRGRLILDKKPYCGSCGTELQVRDLFPVLSGLMLRHRCRYCGAPYPVSHTWTELLVGLLFVLAFLAHGFSEPFMLIVALGVFLITLAAIHANEGIIMGRILLCVTVFGMLLRTLEDGTLYGFFQGGLAGLLVGAALWHRQIRPSGHIYTLPPPALLLAIGGLCVGIRAVPVFLVFFLAFYGIDWLMGKLMRSPQPVLITIPFGLAALLPVLYPKLATLL